MSHSGLCRLALCRSALCRLRIYVVRHNVAFGITVCRLWPYVIRLCVIRCNVVWPNVVQRNVVWPTVGVYYILVVWSVYIILRIYCTVQYSMYCNWYIVNIKYWNLVKNYYFKMKTCQSGKFICIIIFFSNLQILSKTRKQVQCLHRFHENCRK